MVRADVIGLIKESPSAHGVRDEISRTVREVMCEVRSIGMKEMYTAMSQGLMPSYQFRLELAEDYEGERLLTYKGEEYRVIRTYLSGDGIEITAERVNSDV